MKRTRRGALVMIAGSSGLLAVETLGHSSSELERDMSVDVVSDADAYLGLVETDAPDDDGIEESGVLFEGTADGERYPPASFEVGNQLPEPISVTLELKDDRFRFTGTDAADREGERLLVVNELKSGETFDAEIDLDFAVECSSDETPITTPLKIDANGDTTHIEAVRTLTLVTGVLASLDFRSHHWAPNGLLVLRKREVDEKSSIRIEWFNCEERTSTVLEELPLLPVSLIQLMFPDFSGQSMDNVSTQTTETEPDLESSIETAPAVTATVQEPKTNSQSRTYSQSKDNTNESKASESGASGLDNDLVVEVALETTIETDSRSTEEVAVPFDSIDD